mgnify:CR=1 FL=1
MAASGTRATGSAAQASHAAGMAKSGLRPIVDIYSTFLQRSFDQIFQEVALQNLPVTFCVDRAGVVGPDGPTHHGAFDNTWMRVFPNMVVSMVDVGEETGALPDMLLRIADNYEDEVDTAVEGLTSIIEPIMIVFLAVVVGAIAFASGLAGYLRLSPIVICFLAGALVTNFPNDQRDSVFRILNHLERPLHLVFLMKIGRAHV